MSWGCTPSRTKDRTLALAGAVPMSRRPGSADSARDAVGQDVLFVGGERLVSQAAQEVDGRSQADRAGQVRRARLELVGERVVDGLLEADRGDHVAAALVGGHLLEQLAAAVEHADAGGSVHLVARQGVEVAAQGLHVDVEVRGGLGAVDQHVSAAGVGDLGDAPDRVDRAEHVGDVGDGHQLGPRPDEAFELVEQQLAGVVDGRDPETGAPLLADHLPGDDVGVVLHRRDEHLVARAEMGPAVGLGHQVDGLGGAAGEDDLLGVGGVEEAPGPWLGRPRRPRSPARRGSARPGAHWRCPWSRSREIASITAWGFWLVAALSR